MTLRELLLLKDESFEIIQKKFSNITHMMSSGAGFHASIFTYDIEKIAGYTKIIENYLNKMKCEIDKINLISSWEKEQHDD